MVQASTLGLICATLLLLATTPVVLAHGHDDHVAESTKNGAGHTSFISCSHEFVECLAAELLHLPSSRWPHVGAHHSHDYCMDHFPAHL